MGRADLYGAGELSPRMQTLLPLALQECVKNNIEKNVNSNFNEVQ